MVLDLGCTHCTALSELIVVYLATPKFCAIDLNILDQKTGQIVAGKTKVGDNDNIRATWIKLGIPEIATSSGVTTWGANFSNYFDPVHFGIDVNINASLEKAKEYAASEGKDWKTLEADDIFKIDIVTT